MAAQIGSLFVSLTANTGPYAAGMARAEAITARTAGNIRKSVGVAEANVNSFWAATGNRNFRPYSMIAVSRAFDNAADRSNLLRGSILATTAVFGGFAAALSTNVILRYADSYTKLTNLIRVVSTDASDLAARFSAVEDVARRSRSSLEGTAILYGRIQRAVPDQSADEIIRYVETIQKALVLGGATAQEARSAAIQFSQAIASNRLGGEELRAILETPLGLELARGLDVTIGKFREMGHAGELTADVIFGSLDKIAGDIDVKFEKSIRTFDQALIHLDNSFTAFVGKANQSFGATEALSNTFVALGDNLDDIVPTLAAVGVGLAAVYFARNKALAGAAGLGAGGAILGGELFGGAGAIIGGVAGAVLGAKLPGALRETREAASEAAGQVKLLKDEAKAAEIALVDAEKARSDIARRGLRDPGSFAPRSLLTEMERQQFRLQKLDQEHLRLLEQRRVLTTQLFGAQSKFSSQAVDLADKQIDTLRKIDALESRRIVSARRLRDLQGVAALGPGVRDVTGRTFGPSTAEITTAQRDLSKVEKDLIRERETAAAREANIERTRTKVFQDEYNQRIIAARRLDEVNQKIADSDRTRAAAAGDIRGLRSNILIVGGGEANKALAQQAGLVDQYGRSLSKINAEQVKVAASTTLMGQAVTFARAQFGSIVALFGGPWGIALTAAIVGFTVLSAKARQSAQAIKQSEEEIAAAIEELSRRAGIDVPTAVKAQESILEKRIGEVRDTLKRRADDFERIQASLNFAIGRGSVNPAVREITERGRNEVKALVDELHNGTIAVDVFRDRLDEIAGRAPILQPLIDQAAAVAQQIADVGLAAQKTAADLAELEAQQAAPAAVRQTGVERFSPAGAFAADRRRVEDGLKSLNEITTKLQQQQHIQNLINEGKKVEAELWKIVNDLAEDNIRIDEQALRATLERNEALNQASETRKRIADLEKEGLTVGLEASVVAAIEFARSIGVAEGEIQKFAASARTGTGTVSFNLLNTAQAAQTAASELREINTVDFSNIKGGLSGTAEAVGKVSAAALLAAGDIQGFLAAMSGLERNAIFAREFAAAIEDLPETKLQRLAQYQDYLNQVVAKAPDLADEAAAAFQRYAEQLGLTQQQMASFGPRMTTALGGLATVHNSGGVAGFNRPTSGSRGLSVNTTGAGNVGFDTVNIGGQEFRIADGSAQAIAKYTAQYGMSAGIAGDIAAMLTSQTGQLVSANDILGGQSNSLSAIDRNTAGIAPAISGIGSTVASAVSSSTSRFFDSFSAERGANVTGVISGVLSGTLQASNFKERARLRDEAEAKQELIGQYQAEISYLSTIQQYKQLEAAELQKIILRMAELELAAAKATLQLNQINASIGVVDNRIDLNRQYGTFASGGQFKVGGSGGTDSQAVRFMASPNERVTVETPAQQKTADRIKAIGASLLRSRGEFINPREAFLDRYAYGGQFMASGGRKMSYGLGVSTRLRDVMDGIDPMDRAAAREGGVVQTFGDIIIQGVDIADPRSRFAAAQEVGRLVRAQLRGRE